MKQAENESRKRTIFRALFVPLFVIMVLQAVIFYMTAVYGGIEETINQNASDILTERLLNRKNEIQTSFTKSWVNLSSCESEVNGIYKKYTADYGSKPLIQSSRVQVSFLSDVSDTLIKTLRNNNVNGVFLILNDQKQREAFDTGKSEEKVGVCIRDLDQSSNYTDTEDLMLERAPSAVIEQFGCSLDSWWESRYTFESEETGSFYYAPLNAAWENPGADSFDLAYFEGTHRISDSDPQVVSYSIPLIDEEGYPYAVLGVELTAKYLETLMPSRELDDLDKGCYMLALENLETGECTALVGSGAVYSRSFGNDAIISDRDAADTGGFRVAGRDGTLLYGDIAPLAIYNNNNPFENKQLVLLALVEEDELFSYSTNIKKILATVTLLSLALGLCGISLVSRRFSRPITALAKRVETLPPQDGFTLGRLGILEIDQLVHSIEELNRSASRNIARTEFFSRMSHDMRTPMNAIISFSSQELLENTNEAQKQEYLEKIHSSGEYLLGLINEVLDMTKIESNKIDLQYSPMNTSQLWEATLPIIEKLAQGKGVHFITNISMEHTMVMADEQHLSQVVMNLLSNAVKFTPQDGTVRLNIIGRTEASSPEQLQCRVIVSDTGTGMSDEFMQHLYQPFEQENEGHEGTGLGLSIAKKLTDLMGGKIDCVSEKNKGTIFTLDFTLEKCKDQEAVKADAAQTKEEKEKQKNQEITELHGKRILVCEDHPLNTQIIIRILERVGIEVTTAENGKAGLENFQASEENFYDAILMDIRMPVMGGLEAARAIRDLDRCDAAEIPIIAMTANAFSEDVEASRAAGMNAHLSKPIDTQKLYKTLHKLMK